MDHHHDRVRAFGLEARDQRVDAVRLVGEGEAGDAGRRHQSGGVAHGEADDADRHRAARRCRSGGCA